jgi:high-affinity iron transporter
MINVGGGGGSAEEDYRAPLFDIAIATIFAREILEGCIIIGNYRTVILTSPAFADEQKQKSALRTVTMAALLATFVAVVLAASLTVGLYFAGKKMDNATAEIIEGVSKVVAAICVLQLSVKIPRWLGLYANKKENEHGEIEELSERSIRFNVAWNLWREAAEVGVFLIPYMLGDSARSIPISAIVGSVIGILGGIGTYYASRKMSDTWWLAFFLANLTGWLSIGLFTGGCHEFEEVWGETPYIWILAGNFWSHNRFPMVMIKPFGYSHKRTVLQFCTFWSWIFLTIGYHYYKFNQSEKIKREREERKLANELEKTGSTDEEIEEGKIGTIFEKGTVFAVNVEKKIEADDEIEGTKGALNVEKEVDC